MGTIFRFTAVKLFVLALLMTIAVLGAISYYLWTFSHEQHDISLKSVQVEELSNKILHLDEALTHSARMYALRGEEIWKARYDEYYAQIDTTFLKIRFLVDKSEMRLYNQLFTTNTEIDLLEKELIKKVQKGEFMEAQQIVESKAYAQNKQKYAQIAQQLTQKLRASNEQALHHQFQKERWLLVVMLLPVPVLLISWFYVLKFIQFHLDTQKNLEINLKNQEMAFHLSTNEMRLQTETIRQQTENLDAILKSNSKKLLETTQELRKAYAKLADAEKMAAIGLMTASISHEIKNPVGFIYNGMDTLKMYIDTILEVFELYQQTNPENISSQLQKIDAISQQNHLEEILKELPEVMADIKEGALRISEIASGLNNYTRQDQNVSMLDIHRSLETTLIILKGKLRPKNIVIHKDFNYDLPLIECYSGKINQIFLNVLANAIQAIDDKGNIKIKTKRLDGDFVQIIVQDTGQGMDKDTLKRIFDPFFTTKEIGEGTGLGLSIVLQIVEQHKGSIDVDSKLGHGTEIVITLPILQVL